MKFLGIIIIVILIGGLFWYISDDTPGTADDIGKAEELKDDVVNHTQSVITDTKEIIDNISENINNEECKLDLGLIDGTKIQLACLGVGGLYIQTNQEIKCKLPTNNSISYCQETDILRLQYDCSKQSGIFTCNTDEIKCQC